MHGLACKVDRARSVFSTAQTAEEDAWERESSALCKKRERAEHVEKYRRGILVAFRRANDVILHVVRSCSSDSLRVVCAFVVLYLISTRRAGGIIVLLFFSFTIP
jgi:hypothetical protein